MTDGPWAATGPNPPDGGLAETDEEGDRRGAGSLTRDNKCNKLGA